MPLRIRKSLRIAPGLRVNLSKTGLSLSAGRRGMTVNTNRHGTRTTVGLPGTGISYSTRRQRGGSAGIGAMIVALLLVALAVYACARL